MINKKSLTNVKKGNEVEVISFFANLIKTK